MRPNSIEEMLCLFRQIRHILLGLKWIRNFLHLTQDIQNNLIRLLLGAYAR